MMSYDKLSSRFTGLAIITTERNLSNDMNGKILRLIHIRKAIICIYKYKLLIKI